jgi:hypothetical protein
MGSTDVEVIMNGQRNNTSYNINISEFKKRGFKNPET